MQVTQAGQVSVMFIINSDLTGRLKNHLKIILRGPAYHKLYYKSRKWFQTILYCFYIIPRIKMMNRSICFLILLQLFLTHIFAQDIPQLQEVVVTAGRTPISFSELARTVTVLNASDIKNLPTNNVVDLLRYVNAVDLRTRGAEGVQADVGIRGGTFEQSLVLIDGVKISDSQTGHHNMNLPVSIDNVERIEVLKGQGSRMFGPNAFSGVINIITRKTSAPRLSLSLFGGSNSLFETNLFAAYPAGAFGNNISFSKKKSDGYRYNTDFDVTNFSLGENISLSGGNINFLFGYVDKKFGANSFYSDRYPDQWEHTTTKILNASAQFGKDSFTISPKFYWRNNDDDYRLNNTRPDWYRNIHETNSYGAEIQSSIITRYGTTSFGGEAGEEKISSSNLGNHSRVKGGFFAEHLLEPVPNLTASAGVFLYNYSGIGWKLWPGFDLAYKLNDNWRAFASFGKAFRIPTFTELYYTSPANVGNPNLKYEETTNYEFGFSFTQQTWNANASLFLKDGKDLIDWARQTKNDPWKVENVTNVKTAGAEIGVNVFPQKIFSEMLLTKISVNYTYLSASREAGNFESKYLLDHLKHQLLIQVSHNLPFGIKQNWVVRFEDRENFENHFVVDTQLLTQLGSFEIFLRASNLFNKTYYDLAGIPMPGRWLSGGVKYSFGNF